MTDRIVLANMRFVGHHGVTDAERARVQPFEVDVELPRDLREPGRTDDLATTVDYSAVFDTCRSIVETERFRLLEALAERIAAEVIARHGVDDVVVRVRKPEVRLNGRLDYAGVEVRRGREGMPAG